MSLTCYILLTFKQDRKIIAMYQFDMSVYTKIFLKFNSIFWPTGDGTEFFLYASERRGYYPIWQVKIIMIIKFKIIYNHESLTI